VNIVYRRDWRPAADKDAVRAQKIEEFRERFANPFVAAERGYVDDVIEPRETRAAVIRALRMLENKVDTMPRKKHGNIPLLPGPAQRDGADHDQVRHAHRVPPSRSRHRRPVRDRSALRQAGEVGGQHDAVQVHHPQRGQPVRQDGDLHAQAAVRRQRQRHAHAPELWKDGKPLFGGDGYAGFSQMALWYIGGLLKHARALSAIIAPTTNSYKRLVPGYEAPVNLAYSRRNRSAACRIPMYSASPKAKRVEFRPPDPSANPYLAFRRC
jgi:hypothetical protein